MSLKQLTRAEHEVVVLLSQGMTNREIAQVLWRTEQTVKFHIGNVFRRFGFRNRVEAATAYVRAIELDQPWPEARARPVPPSPLAPGGVCKACGEDPAGIDGLCLFCVEELGTAA